MLLATLYVYKYFKINSWQQQFQSWVLNDSNNNGRYADCFIIPLPLHAELSGSVSFPLEHSHSQIGSRLTTTLSPSPWAFITSGLSASDGHLLSVSSTSKSTRSLILRPSQKLVSTRPSFRHLDLDFRFIIVYLEIEWCLLGKLHTFLRDKKVN